MKNCLFCKISTGSSKSYKIYEDKNYFGFLDIKPKMRGDSLLIPKKHYRWVYETEDFEKYWGAALKLTQAIQRALNPMWINYFTYGAFPHAHIHILPRFEENKGKNSDIIPDPINLSKSEMKQISEKILKHSNSL